MVRYDDELLTIATRPGKTEGTAATGRLVITSDTPSYSCEKIRKCSCTPSNHNAHEAIAIPSYPPGAHCYTSTHERRLA
ncbi:hypothetical protein V496_05591 [Pseudogymnoascus sp. VKM F-4515 (FW-2607)]|nr:hypothetical protein V496_05591 [Pseudogymnoascus sp. VKM F-4515 (FW-2607)]KFY91958.1 hypothetical protein V498_05223 [Pseudogymnoascus sp. VKM F-4517 (FW-2822)]